MSTALKVAFAASELSPFAKRGGLADVSAGLPLQLQRSGHVVRVFVPFYSCIDRAGHAFHRVDFAQDVPVELGPHRYTFSLWTTNLPDSDLAIYLVVCSPLYAPPEIYTADPDEALRFGFFSRAVLESCQRMGFAPDLFHCNDWHTAVIPLLLKTTYKWDRLLTSSRTVLTIHNIGYQGIFRHETIRDLGLDDWAHLFDQQDLDAGRVNFLRTGLLYADAVTTVSPRYAREIQTAEFGMGLDGLLRARSGTVVGILNGVDYDQWSPQRDPFIPHRYSPRRMSGKNKNKTHLLQTQQLAVDGDAPLIGVISRLAHQKGFELCYDVLPELFASTDVRMVVLGTGERQYEDFFEHLSRRFPQRVAYRRAYDEELAHLIEAGSDLFLMPSRYEPCGLNQMFSLKYGTVPIVRKTGGLADSVIPFNRETGEGTGIVFEHFDAQGLRWALQQALSLYTDRPAWRRLVANAMAANFSWEVQARRYVELYSKLGG